MSTRILVTGGAGFIGSHLCERLVSEGNEVISLDNYFAGSRRNHIADVEYREGHTKDIERLVPEAVDLVYHLGEYARVEKSFEDIETVWDLNKTGTFAVLEFVRRRGAKLVYAGSSTKFADGGMGRDQSPYAWAKATNTELVKNYGTWYGIRYAITYFYNVYGPRERAGALGTVIEIFRQNYLAGRPLPIVAPGNQKRNFTHVDDIINGLLLVGEKGDGDEFGIGDERSYSVLEVAGMFGTSTVMLPERSGNRADSTVDTARVRALGWSVKRHLPEYIKDIVATEPQKLAGNRVLVFSTTFHPVEGPAERALRLLIERMPGLSFDIITTKWGGASEEAYPNARVHRVGNGSAFDKFFLPFLGARKARELQKEGEYLFAWSIMASYGALAAVIARQGLPLLVTLADQRMRFHSKLFLRFVLRNTDQVYASTPEQGKTLSSLSERMASRKSLGEGDAFMNPIRFAYSAILRDL